MLHVIHQNGIQKLSVDSYFVELRDGEKKPEDQEPPVLPTIIGVGQSIGGVDLAQYDKLEDAVRIFSEMVSCEFSGRLCVLPKDDPKEIAAFLKGNNNEMGILFDSKNEEKK